MQDVGLVNLRSPGLNAIVYFYFLPSCWLHLVRSLQNASCRFNQAFFSKPVFSQYHVADACGILRLCGNMTVLLGPFKIPSRRATSEVQNYIVCLQNQLILKDARLANR